jgi:protein ImuB
VVTVWCPDWPVVIHRRPPEEPVAAVANRIVACSPGARSFGVQRGQRRREAQGRCPGLVLVERDVAAEARSFEAVARALDGVCPRLELTRPGLCAFPARGPGRYFGGDEAVAAEIHRVVGAVLEGRGQCHVGVAEGTFAAGLAARAAPRGPAPTCVVPPGDTPAFLAPLAVTLLEMAELTDVLLRLGIATLGDLAALAAKDVLARFGTVGERAHRLARGEEHEPPATAVAPPELTVVAELDPPLERVDQAAFVGKRLADELLERLDHMGATCTSILVEAETEHGEYLARCWRHEGALSAGAVADRIRWQLDGWITPALGAAGPIAGLTAGPTAGPIAGLTAGPTAGLTRLAVRPDRIVAATGRQLGFWGERTEGTDRAIRAVARLQGLLGPGAVRVPERRGGRSPGERIVLVPAEVVELDRASIDGTGTALLGGPWPGALPAPAPARVALEPQPVEVLDAGAAMVTVSGRGVVSAPPATLVIGRRRLSVTAWAGPWPLDERWWDTLRRRRQARFQLLTDDGVARLCVIEAGRWWVTATYD